MATQRSVITVGNFDGVHVGHRALLRAARELADGKAQVVAVTFTRNPLHVLRPTSGGPPTLMDSAQRQKALLAAGADQVLLLEPTPELLGLAPEQFVDRMLADLNVAGWVEGPDFHFGKDRAGDMAMLRELGRGRGFEVRQVAPATVTLRDQHQAPVSSTLVRWLVACGRMADAELCLAQPFTMRGQVVRGEQRGRTIGFPTANLDTGDRVVPLDGVYGGTVEIDGREHAAAISVGVKPTFGQKQRCFEAFIIDYRGDLYGRVIEVKLLRFLRDQAIFPGVESLIEQMNRDVERVRGLHAAGRLSAAPHEPPTSRTQVA